MKHILITIAAVVLVGCEQSAIHDAAAAGDLAAIQAELDKGVDVNAKDNDGRTPLHYAAKYATKEVVELLIPNGADVNAKDNYGATPLDWAIDDEIADLIRNHGGKTGEESTALIDAAADGNIEVVKQLLAAGANVNAKNKWGGTPLHWAARGGHKEIVELLIAKGANVNAKNDEDGTPLHLAADRGHTEVVELLITKGADVNAKDDEGETPLDQAGTSWPETADLLRKHGGKTGEELALMPRLVQHGRFAFSFDAKEGKVYEVQDSFDLLNWEVIKTYTGTGASVRFDEERDHDPPKWFYRVRVVE